MKILKIPILVIVLFIGLSQVQGQTPEVKNYAIKKGQLFDILLINTKKDAGDKLAQYFKEVFPIAEAEGYNRIPSLRVIDAPTQGNYQPDAVVFGFWNDFDSRRKFLERIEKEVPNFHQSRRDIWSNFSLAYYELTEDLSFEVNPSSFNVMTHYWKKASGDFSKFKNEWLKKVKKAGGKVSLSLGESQSPFGYLYAPDFCTITTWESRAQFEAFYKENLSMNHEAIKHVNQFIVQ